MKNTQKGFIALYLTLLVVFVLSGIGASAFGLISSQQHIIKNTKTSLQAYYVAEAGVEDALHRVKNSLQWVSPISLGTMISNANISTTVSGIGAVKIITATGDDASRIRKVEVVYSLSGIAPQFFYGAHVGAGGIEMDNNSSVVGNVFSSGNIQGNSGAEITGTATVSGVGGQVSSGISIGGDAFMDHCESAQVAGTLYANTNNECSFGAFVSLGEPPLQAPLPITSGEIQAWKDAAEAGGIISGNYILDGSDTASLGPKKIIGNVTIENQAVWTLTGNIWVTGNVEIKNDARVLLDASFDAASGVIVADGVITIQNNSISSGSGIPGSYLMYLSTNAGNPAVNAKNNVIADILYASSGWILVENNLELHKITGHGVHLKNNAIITYETGLSSATFSSGPGASWELISWKEVE
ncbi:MAG: pilus assembly PilX N-terminal domain-containing protein [bacterium]|nr:pilus assembly PilX N-terminal domain-containing protein [bacterium]